MTNTTVSSGVTSSGITLNSFGDNAFVYGTAVSTTVNNGGVEYVYLGGATSFTTVSNSGVEIVSSGATAGFTTVSNGGIEFIYGGGATSFTTVSSGGAEVVSSGGTADFTTISFGGTEDVYQYGATSFTTVSNGGTEFIYVDGTTTSTRDEATIRVDGGTAIYTSVTGNYTHLDVFSGGRTISTTVGGDGVERVSAGGTASFTTVSSGGYEFVSSGGTTFDTVLSNATEYVYSGGNAVNTSVSDALIVVYPRGRAIGAILGGGGQEVLYLQTIARDTVVHPGGTIDVTYLPYASGGSATVDSSDLLTVSVGGQTYTQQLSGEYANADFQLAPGENYVVYGGTAVTNEAPCYRSGTRIRTDRGEIAIEDLLVGDMVQTVLGDATAPIIWIGRREIDCAHHPKPRKVWPVRVAAGAFGPAQPHTDLFLSPDRAVYVNDVLIPIRCLVNGSTITQVPVDRVTYLHIELPHHDVVLAEGLPAESFLDLKDGSNYSNRSGLVRLYPDYTARMWEAFGCARLIVTGPELVAAHALVESFAKARAAA